MFDQIIVPFSVRPLHHQNSDGSEGYIVSGNDHND